jgi:hypothetical protein
MIKRIYEILDECKLEEDIEGVFRILRENDSPALREVLRCTYHPNADWYVKELPEDYILPDTLPGISQTNLYTEIKRIYLFQKGHAMADQLSQEKRLQLLTQLLEGLEPGDVQVLLNIFKKDQEIQGLDKNSVNLVFPDLI